MICSSPWSRQVCAEPRKYYVSLDLFILTPLINLEDRELCNFPDNWYQSFGYRDKDILSMLCGCSID